MRNLFTTLLLAALIPCGAQALAAQQAPTTRSDTAHMGMRTRTHHTVPSVRRAARRHERTSMRAERRESRATELREQRLARRRSEMREERHETRATELREERAARLHRARIRTMTVTTIRTPVVLGTPVTVPGYVAPRTTVITVMPGRMSRMRNGLLTADAASSIALRSVSGGTSVKKITLHRENGVMVYDVKVLTPAGPGNQEVRVDATTGAVIRTMNVDNPVGAVTHGVKHAIKQVTH